MNALFLTPECQTPRVEFYPDGKLLLEGRSRPENIFLLFNPLISFASHLKTPKVEFNINLEYFNTGSASGLLLLLKALEQNMAINELNVIWHYEADDEDNFEMGEIYEASLPRTHFYYSQHKDKIVLAEV